MTTLALRVTLVFAIAAAAVVAADDFAQRSPAILAKEFVAAGCYRDKFAMTERVLPNIRYLDAAMTIDKCTVRCGQAGFPFAGIEFGSECYCGTKKPSEELPASECAMDCGGAAAKGAGGCGGRLALTLYTAPGLGRRPATRPLVCLAIMVKNEAHTIETTLNSVKGLIDNYVILDTGSTDGTQQVMLKALATHGDETNKMVGALVEEPFIDYGASRNRNLDLCKERFNSVFTLVLSADETVGDAAALRQFLEEMRFSEGEQHGAYPVRMDMAGGEPFDSVRIARVDAKWRYVGRVHEYLTAPTPKWTDLYRPIPEVMVRFDATDGPRRMESQRQILNILLEDLANDPKDTRAMLYIARTYGALQEWQACYDMYAQLAAGGKFHGEVYYALVMQALVGLSLNHPWEKRLATLTKAFEVDPHQRDACHLIAQTYYNDGFIDDALKWAVKCLAIPRPPYLEKQQNIFMRRTEYLYEFEMARLTGLAAAKAKSYTVCIRALDEVLVNMPGDALAVQVRNVCAKGLADGGGDGNGDGGAPAVATDAASAVAAGGGDMAAQAAQVQQPVATKEKGAETATETKAQRIARIHAKNDASDAERAAVAAPKRDTPAGDILAPIDDDDSDDAASVAASAAAANAAANVAAKARATAAAKAAADTAAATSERSRLAAADARQAKEEKAYASKLRDERRRDRYKRAPSHEKILKTAQRVASGKRASSSFWTIATIAGAAFVFGLLVTFLCRKTLWRMFNKNGKRWKDAKSLA
jgi:hypothetical protein